MTITIDKNYEGAFICSTVIDNQLIKFRYYGYTKKESLQAFKNRIESIKRNDKDLLNH